MEMGQMDQAAEAVIKAIEICGVFLLRAYLDGNDMHARQKMHVASCLAGLSFNTAGLQIANIISNDEQTRQRIDRALLQNSMLRGEALTQFVRRSVEMIK